MKPLRSILPSRKLQPGESPRIAVAIQHVETRAHLLPRLWEQLGGDAHLPSSAWAGAKVVHGDLEARNPWATYQAALAFNDHLPDATHLLIVQDDALLVPRFHERLAEHVALKPDDVLCCYVPNQPAYMARAVHAAFGMGRRFAQLPNGMFCPLVCTCWPLDDAADVLVWEDTVEHSRQRRCDDAQISRWLRRRRRFALGIVPSLADHDEVTPSTLGLGRYRRHAAIVAGA